MVAYFLEAAIRPIQISFRNRYFKINFKKYREELNKWKGIKGNFLNYVLYLLLKGPIIFN